MNDRSLYKSSKETQQALIRCLSVFTIVCDIFWIHGRPFCDSLHRYLTPSVDVVGLGLG